MAQLHVTRVRREFREVVNSEEVRKEMGIKLQIYTDIPVYYVPYLLYICLQYSYAVANSITATYCLLMPDLTSYM